jgi:starch synthase (maltosyl-transferring)
MNDAGVSPGPRIYNLFPLLAGPFPRWTSYLERARAMEFNWVFINPFHRAGYSGSLYSIADYYDIDPRLVDSAGGPPQFQLRQAIEKANSLGLNMMMDLVINHTAFDSPLLRQHPSWYKRGPDGNPVHPGADENGRTVTWGDLVEIDNVANRDGLWQYWIDLALHYAGVGFTGFRCDAAYKVPSELWRLLIGRVKQAHPRALFFAESLGCPFEDTVKLAQSGFDFIFNSSKWWDFTAPWCLEQYRRTSGLIPSISFPESHDTDRLAAELNGDREAVKMRYAFAALFSSGVMMPMGFEYGFRRRLHVVKTRPEDWEDPSWDISGFVTAVNRLKQSRRVFNEEGSIEAVALDNANIFAFVKWSKDRRERALALLNKDSRGQQSFRVQLVGNFLASAARVEDLSPEGSLPHTPDFQTCFLKPSGAYVIWAQAA